MTDKGSARWSFLKAALIPVRGAPIPNQFHPRIQTLRRESKCLRCTRCQQDVAECPSGAWEQIGRDVTLDNLLQEVLKDEVFFRASGGGVTLSGGEVLMQAGFAARFLQRLRQWGSAPPSKPRATALLTAFAGGRSL